MLVLPFHPGPRLPRAGAALAVGLVLRKALGRFLAEDDPRRQLIAQAHLHAGTFIVIAAPVWLKHRG